MKIFLKLIVEKVFGGLTWLFKSFIEHWKMWAIILIVGYVVSLNFKVRDLEADNIKLSDTVFAQDSTIVAIGSKYMVDSVNLAMREISMQNTVAQVNQENKSIKKENETLKKENTNLNQLVSDMKKGLKRVNIFGKIVDNKK